MITAKPAWVRLGNSGVTAAIRALLAWWLPFLIIPGLVLCFGTLMAWGVYGSSLVAWLLGIVLFPTLIAFGWYCWYYRALKINPETGQLRRGWGSVIAAGELTFAVTLAKNPQHPVIVFGNEHWRMRLHTANKVTGKLSAKDYQLFVQTLETSYFVQDYTKRSLVGDGIRVPTRVRKRETLVSDMLGLEPVSYDSAGFIRLLNLLQREAAGPAAEGKTPGKHRRRLALRKQIPNQTTGTGRNIRANVRHRDKQKTPAFDTLRFMLSGTIRSEQRNLIAWLRGNGNFLYLGRGTVQILGSILLFLFVVGYPFITFWIYAWAYEARIYWLEDIVIGFTVVGTLLILFMIHPALLLIRWALINRYQRVHSAVAAELHQRAIDQEMTDGAHDREEKPKEARLAGDIPTNFGSLEYFLKAKVHLSEKVIPDPSNTRLAAPAPETPRSARPDFGERPALIREVLAIIDRDQPITTWREKYYGSMAVFGIVWIIYLIVFWVLGFVNPWGGGYRDLLLAVFMAPAVFLTGVTIAAWAKLIRFAHNILRREYVIAEEREWLLVKIREGSQP